MAEGRISSEERKPYLLFSECDSGGNILWVPHPISVIIPGRNGHFVHIDEPRVCLGHTDDNVSPPV